jgi:hypothetical protein
MAQKGLIMKFNQIIVVKETLHINNVMIHFMPI